MTKVIASVPTIPHFCAWCHECDWVFQNYMDRDRGYIEIRRHVRETGHAVILEKSVHTTYFLDDEGDEKHARRSR